jgi:Na+-translocating ferredoxin:NAD+ oxidoreductase RNF subunit RnfB
VGEVLQAGAIMLSVAGLFGVVLAIAHRFLHVEEDPRVDAVEGRLAGTNCGACGQPGCHAFAEALVGGAAKPGQCTVTAPERLEEIAALLGVDVGAQEKRVARLHCAGGRAEVRRIADYDGVKVCGAAFLVNGGGRACSWGCLGFGDCERACTFDAIRMSDDELPVVDVLRCTACGDCVTACPLDLFKLEPLSARPVVQCSAPLTGDAARSACRVACDACGRCAADAPGLIEMKNGLAVIDYARVEVANPAATARCPTGAIVWLEGEQQFASLKQLVGA